LIKGDIRNAEKIEKVAEVIVFIVT